MTSQMRRRIVLLNTALLYGTTACGGTIYDESVCGRNCPSSGTGLILAAELQLTCPD
jgi:hypothetical protein